MKKVTTNLRKTSICYLQDALIDGEEIGNTDMGLALVGRNSKGTQARKQNMVKEKGFDLCL